ncbi:hypothetical protein K431DRAFT_311310 [Polychaeton citri CBS 116435]|uniref:NWD NACHT-NTPase N-terminal domain-containing protein n=1 Tax=Polychaeton citri CBS 116435 TaxID=1314669 RepID=A0A9P4QDM7_9PEZI|nr:hypothetical protein K431DRAFT_311310 [Polychaeton citri CBS 116435]
MVIHWSLGAEAMSHIAHSPIKSLWTEAWQTLRQKNKDTLPLSLVDNPSNLLADIEHQRKSSKGDPVKLPTGETFFVRNVLEKIARWIKEFVEVGDVAVQFDSVHAALPWAALRLVLQASVNNLDKHATVLEGIESTSHDLLWSKVAEEIFLQVPNAAHDQLEQRFIELYQSLLIFLALLKYIANIKIDVGRMTDSPWSTDSNLRQDLEAAVKARKEIEKLTSQIAKRMTIEQSGKLRKIINDLEDLAKPISRIEYSVHSIQEVVDRSEQYAILDWASRIPYEMHFNAAQKKALDGTRK